ncbi:MAG TPA: YacL family protein [Oscillatoriaceae cyanobacterium M33_DOE_052]|uniref:Uncharacterized protein n=1 Tax=Planktothricoides sp. SpSt-374 TaxID=2282167 RepID=A0A7C3VL82_9CYAN|nr:YacL family protein [Oscillatoriaceae cyanobacterium M33_DOE_052]
MPAESWNWSDWTAQSSAHQCLLEFLTLDIQNSPEWVQHLLTQIAALETGEITTWTRSGNAYHLTFSPQNVTIENMAGATEPIETISLQEFKAAVLAWQHQIETNPF